MSSYVYWCSSLVGGSTGDLDSIDGADLNDGDAAFVIASDSIYFYTLDADSAAVEDSPEVIEPDTNAGDKRWIRISPYKVIESKPASGEYQIKKITRTPAGLWKMFYDETAES